MFTWKWQALQANSNKKPSRCEVQLRPEGLKSVKFYISTRKLVFSCVAFCEFWLFLHKMYFYTKYFFFYKVVYVNNI
jgi:hypothetical protein